MFNEFTERSKKPPTFFSGYSNLDLDTGRSQEFDTTSVDLRKRIGLCDDDTMDSRSEDSLCAGWCLTMMAAGLERDVESGSLKIAVGIRDGVHFGMRLAEMLVPAFTHDLIIQSDDAAHHGVGFNTSLASLGEFQGVGHHRYIDRIVVHQLSQHEDRSPRRDREW